MYSKVIVFLLILIVSVEAKEITLNKAINIALENNKQNKISKLALEIAKVQYKQAVSVNYPIINATIMGKRSKSDLTFDLNADIKLPSDIAKSLAFSNLLSQNGMPLATAQASINSQPASAFENQTLPLDSEITAYGRDSLKASLNVLYHLYTGGRASSIIEQAQLNKLLAKNTIKREELKVVFDIKKYFYGYIYVNEYYKIINSYLKRMEYVSDLTKRFYEEGDSLNVRKTDYLSIRVTVSLVEATLAKIDANRKLLKSALANTMGLKWNDEIQVKYKNQNLPKPNDLLEVLIKEAYKNNDDISKVNILLKVSSEQIKEQKAGHYPTLSLLANTSHSYDSNKAIGKEDSWNIGFFANIPLFEGFKTTSKVMEKKIEKKKLALLQDIVKDGLALRVKNELTKALSSYKQVKLLGKSSLLAKENRELNIRGYEIGAIKPKEVFDAQYLEVYVKSDYIKYVNDYLLSLAKIDRLVGKIIK